MIPVIVAITIAALALVVGFLLGSAFTGDALKRENRGNRSYLRRLEAELAELSASLQNDEMRAGIDTGKDYVLMLVQETLDRIRGERP